ncbi:hypothetical protein [Allofrancisella frigidaquae]|uniref:Uncharacterized protein n=1 Tax=Allofrancisella frigidaquae TaxID=1085644 RepID=A0A6M3HUW8_9GAMM|nr:hypothetical protein [Allofrancisella frigidaquae]QIV94927.1 hypothetical protein E3E15_06010 [Allofrancisella frigidaquae]
MYLLLSKKKLENSKDFYLYDTLYEKIGDEFQAFKSNTPGRFYIYFEDENVNLLSPRFKSLIQKYNFPNERKIPIDYNGNKVKNSYFGFSLTKRPGRDSYVFNIHNAFVGPLMAKLGLRFNGIAKYALFRQIELLKVDSICISRIVINGIVEPISLNHYEKIFYEPNSFNSRSDPETLYYSFKNYPLQNKPEKTFLGLKGWGYIISKLVRDLEGSVVVLKYKNQQERQQRKCLSGADLIIKVCDTKNELAVQHIELAHKLSWRIDASLKKMDVRRLSPWRNENSLAFQLTLEQELLVRQIITRNTALTIDDLIKYVDLINPSHNSIGVEGSINHVKSFNIKTKFSEQNNK